jgi:hypothetical protein
MAKKKRQLKRPGARSIGSKKGKRKKSAKPKLTLKQRLARAKKLEALDARKPVSGKRAQKSRPQTRDIPAVAIINSVGRWEENASNSPEDVKTVQRLLETAAQKLHAPELDPKGVDGKIAQPPRHSKLFRAVLVFQLMD